MRCNSGHTRQVDLQSFGRPPTSSRVSLAKKNRTMTFQRNPFLQVRIRQDQMRPMKTKAKLRQNTECEGRHHHPLKKKERSSRSRRSPSLSCSMQPMETNSSASWRTDSPGESQSNPTGRMRVHMARIDDVILDDDESEAALTHVPAGRDALLILAFLKDQDYGIRLSEALTDQTIEAKNIVAAYEPDGTSMVSNNWIMKKASQS